MLPHECWAHDAERGRVVSEGGAVIARVNTKGQDPTRAPYAHQDARIIASDTARKNVTIGSRRPASSLVTAKPKKIENTTT